MRLGALWEAQAGPQREILGCPADLLLVGGGRGGGKTHCCLLGDWPQHLQRLGGRARGLVVRKRAVHAQQTMREVEPYYRRIGGVMRSTGSDKWFVWSNGATQRWAYLAGDEDTAAYSGHNYTWILIEEVNQIGSWKAVYRLFGTLRGVRLPEKRFLMTCNPEGPGLLWLKERFVTPHPAGRKVFVRRYEKGGREMSFSQVYIPMRLQDNVKLTEGDPNYEARLLIATEGDPAKRRAWLEGDWEALAGQFFRGYGEWSRQAVLRPFSIPRGWFRFVSLDWGSAVPFAVQWWAVAAQTVVTHRGDLVPENSLVMYREYYGAEREGGSVQPNVGVQLDAEQVGWNLAQRMSRDPELPEVGVADPSAFARVAGPSIIANIQRGEHAYWRQHRGDGRFVAWRPADNTRVGMGDALGGWDEVRRRMHGVELESGGRRPLLYVFDGRSDLMRTLPLMIHDPNRPDDMLKKGAEDHAVDALRYACMLRPVKGLVEPEPRGILDALRERSPRWGQVRWDEPRDTPTYAR